MLEGNKMKKINKTKQNKTKECEVDNKKKREREKRILLCIDIITVRDMGIQKKIERNNFGIHVN